MWQRPFMAVVLVLTMTLVVSGQSGSVSTRAMPPDRAAIERLNLKTEWTVNLPIDTRKDAISVVQTFDDQLFVQTKTGQVIAIDAATGRIQWSTQLGNGGPTNTYRLATNSQFVYVVNVTKLYSFHRYTGVVEFVTDLESPLTTGLAADESGVYCVLGVRSGTGGSVRLAVYNLPRPIVIFEAAKAPQLDPSGRPIKDPKSINPVDNLTGRYAQDGTNRANQPDTSESRSRPRVMEAPVGGYSGSRTPSLATVPRVTPPYTLDSEATTPSINSLQSFRQPYHLRTEFQKDIQQTASINAIPPSVAAALALADLRPKTIEPPVRWEYGFTSRVVYPLTLAPHRVWAITDSQDLIALSKPDKKLDVSQHFDDPVSAPPGRGGVYIYVPLSSGFLMAVDGSIGEKASGASILWRTAVGGINNRAPFVTENMVYAEGDNSGVVAVDRKTGSLVWRSEDTADQIIAANRELLYVRNRHGKLLVFNALRATDPIGKRSMPLAGIDLSEFTIPIVNTVSDRVFLAADNGLIVCMRDLSPKYARPVRICPEITVNLPPKGDGLAAPPSKESAIPNDPPAEKKKDMPKK